MKDSFPFSNGMNEIDLAIEAVTKAARSIMKIYNQDFSVSFKEDKEPITQADISSNQIIEKILSESGLLILSEESKDQIEKRLESKKIWIVDPLDGTTDFAKKTGEFTIMIGLVKDQVPILGVICSPSTNTIFLAQKEDGAYMQTNDQTWQRLRVSGISEINHCKVVGSRFHQTDRERSFLEQLEISKFTSRGSSLKVADISSGKAELYFTTTDKIKQWDTCASYCIIKEAGGKMTDMFGNDLKYNTKKLNHENGLLVTNGIIL